MTSSGGDPAYVMLVEDDALPMEDFFPVLARILSHHVERHWRGGDLVEHSEKVAYVKFYHPDRLLGYWSVERERLTDLVGVVVLCGTVLAVLYCAACDDASGVHLAWVLSCAYCLGVVLVIGRANVNELRRLVC